MSKICYVARRFHRATMEVIDRANEIIKEYAEQGFDLTLRQLYYQFVARLHRQHVRTVQARRRHHRQRPHGRSHRLGYDRRPHPLPASNGYWKIQRTSSIRPRRHSPWTSGPASPTGPRSGSRRTPC